MIIVGVSGPAGSGKDTTAAVFEKYGFTRVAFADELKRTAMRWFGFTPVQLWGPSEYRNIRVKEGGPTARKVTQYLGTEVGRHLDPDLWINLMGEVCARITVGMPSVSNQSYAYNPIRGLHVVEGWRPPPIGIVIPDMRFKNEVEAVTEWGGVLVRIKRNTSLEGEEAQHASETEQQEIPDEVFDAIIDNDSTLEEFEAKIHRLAVEIINGAPD